MPARVARIPNLECEAFYYDMERRGIALLDMEPNAVAGALEQGEIDAGPVSLLDVDRLTAQAELISGFCVASVNRAVRACCFPTRRSTISPAATSPLPSRIPRRCSCSGSCWRRSTV